MYCTYFTNCYFTLAQETRFLLALLILRAPLDHLDPAPGVVLDHLVLDVVGPALGLVLLHADLPLAVDAVSFPVLRPRGPHVNHDRAVRVSVAAAEVGVAVGDGVVTGVAEGADEFHAAVWAYLNEKELLRK